jgi:hypothetical protein
MRWMRWMDSDEDTGAAMVIGLFIVLLVTLAALYIGLYGQY